MNFLLKTVSELDFCRPYKLTESFPNKKHNFKKLLLMLLCFLWILKFTVLKIHFEFATQTYLKVAEDKMESFVKGYSSCDVTGLTLRAWGYFYYIYKVPSLIGFSISIQNEYGCKFKEYEHV